MRFWQYTVAVGLAGLVFAAALVSEYWQFEQYVNIDQIEISSGVVDINSSYEDRLLSTGEFVRSFSGANFSFSDRVLEEGTIFVGGTFFEPDTIPRETWAERGMTFEGLEFTENMLRAGPLLIYYPTSNVLVERNSDWERTDVWAFGHSVEIWFAGARQPFVLPSEMHISIRESLINASTHELYYSKLRKDFQLQSYELPQEVVRMRSMEQLMLQSLLAHQELRDSFKPIAWDVLRTWRGGAIPTTTMGKILRQWHRASLKYAIGVSDRKRDNFEFLAIVAPLVETWRTADAVTVDKVAQNVKWFREEIDASVEWKRLLDRSTFWNNQWEQFFRAQKMWLPGRTPGTGAAAFGALWANDFSAGVPRLQQHFSAAEVFIANGFKSEAVRELKQFSQALKTTKTTRADRFEITRFRRLLTALLKQHDVLQRPEMFALLEDLVELEATLHVDDPEFVDEIHLEAAQDLLFFIKMFLDTSVDSAIPAQLLEYWHNRKVDDLADKYGREIFSADEKEVLAYISLAGADGVGADEILAIQQSQNWRSEMERLIQNLMMPDAEDAPLEVESDEQAKELAQWLETQSTEWKWVVLFQSNTEWKLEGKNLEGMVAEITFAPKTGLGGVEIGGKQQTGVPRMNLPRVLRILQEEMITETPVETEEWDNLPAQTTPEAVLERRYVQQLLRSVGLEVERSAVLMLDEGASLFQIQEATWTGYTFTFEFQKEGNIVQNVVYRQSDREEPLMGTWELSEFIHHLEVQFGTRAR